MLQSEQMLLTYLHLARASQLRRQLLVRDKLLVLAGVEAAELGWEEIADGCRSQVLAHNPRHLVRRWSNIDRAVGAERFDSYLKRLRRKYSPERAEHLLQTLGISLAGRSEELYPPRERAAALVDVVAQLQTDHLEKSPTTLVIADIKTDWLATWAPFWFALAVLVIVAVLWAVGKVG